MVPQEKFIGAFLNDTRTLRRDKYAYYEMDESE